MMKNKIIFGLSTVALALVIAFATSSYAAQTNTNQKGFGVGPENRDEHMAQMTEIFESGNYTEWANLMNEKATNMVQMAQERANTIKNAITQENFQKLSEIHKLRLEGKYNEARELMKKYTDEGLELGFGREFGKFGGRGVEIGDFCGLGPKAPNIDSK